MQLDERPEGAPWVAAARQQFFPVSGRPQRDAQKLASGRRAALDKINIARS